MSGSEHSGMTQSENSAKQTQTVRTRYAPSPTGEQHIGGLRTALYSYLFARVHDGEFVVRVEDTDRARFQPDAAARILASLSWIGIAADESPIAGGGSAPYTQSERLPLYRTHAEELVAAGCAYWAYDSDEELAELRVRGRGYDGRGRRRSEAENSERRARGISGVMRFATPSDDGESGWEDMVLGQVSRKHADIACDPVLLKSDGYPTYHLASVVDDHAMRITHVLRAQEWLSSTPLHLLLYQAFGWEPPAYAHLPLIIGADGKKLSKRHGATAVSAFQEQGILPAALCNYIALLGWSPDDNRERFSLTELERLFTVQRVQKSAATFDWQKLRWHNSYYLRQMASKELLREICEALPKESGGGAEEENHNTMDGIREVLTNLAAVKQQDDAAADILADALKERIQTAAEAHPWLQYLLPAASSASAALLRGKKLTADQATAALRCVASFSDDELATPALFEARLRDYCQAHDLPFGHSIGVLRVALSGEKSSLPTQVMLATLPITVIHARIDAAIAIIADNSTPA